MELRSARSHAGYNRLRSTREITVWVEPLDQFALSRCVGLRKPLDSLFVGVSERHYRSWNLGYAENHWTLKIWCLIWLGWMLNWSHYCLCCSLGDLFSLSLLSILMPVISCLFSRMLLKYFATYSSIVNRVRLRELSDLCKSLVV